MACVFKLLLASLVVQLRRTLLLHRSYTMLLMYSLQ